eukprot:symbB.v1.2.025223.t3/scaffold2429.1/size79298/3
MFEGSLRPGHLGIELDDDTETLQVVPEAELPDANVKQDARSGKTRKRPLPKSEDSVPQNALSKIKVKAEQLGDVLARTGTHVPPGRAPLAWAVLRPSNEPPEVRRTRLALARRSSKAEEEDTTGRRLRRCKPGSRPEVTSKGPEDAVRIDKAAALLQGLLGDDAMELATALAKACLVDGSRHRLMALAAALKSNEELRRAILNAGPEAAASFAQQDPRDWAKSELQVRRKRWMQEAMQEAKVPSGHMAVCPECGGKAFVNTGRAGSGRAARLSKQQKKLLMAWEKLAKHVDGKAFTVGVFCNKEDTADKVAQFLSENVSVKVVLIHGSLMDLPVGQTAQRVAMATRGKLGEWENPDTVVRSEDWQEAIRKGCEMVQIASERKVRELERRLDHLKTEAETLRRKGEELRTIHLNLESDLKDSKNQNKAQMESNKKLAQEVFAMRTDMSKLGQFRASLDQAVSYVDSRK